MLKSKVNEFLGKLVEIKIYDGDIYTGILTICEELKNCYYCAGTKDYIYKFKSSHITKIRILKNN